MIVRVLDSIEAVDADAWDRLAGPASFGRHGWLAALEVGGVTVPERGWTPAHVVLEDNGELVAAVPLWVREDSYGEFVWDEPIESACRRDDFPYAPRAVADHPWIPATGRKLLTHPDRDRTTLVKALGEALKEVARARGWASVNILFCASDEGRVLSPDGGYVVRLTWQYHWHDRAYGSFDGFLKALKASRRQRIKREMRELQEQGIEVVYRPGDAADFARMGRLYADTWARYEGGEPALTPVFFAELGRRAPGDVRFGVASRGDEVVGMTLNAVLGDAMFGRWWGCTESIRFLHFNVAYHCAVEHCLQEGLVRFEPGHGGDFKRVRGFDPTLAHSVHWYADPHFHAAIVQWSRREARWVLEKVAKQRAEAPFRQAVDPA